QVILRNKYLGNFGALGMKRFIGFLPVPRKEYNIGRISSPVAQIESLERVDCLYESRALGRDSSSRK
ncbi:hypothetical protein THAOC_01128, partial [Thalassiosira oceanica]